MISQPDGGKMRIAGIVWLPLRIGRAKGDELYLTSDLCSDQMLCEDWLKGCGKFGDREDEIPFCEWVVKGVLDYLYVD